MIYRTFLIFALGTLVVLATIATYLLLALALIVMPFAILDYIFRGNKVLEWYDLDNYFGCLADPFTRVAETLIQKDKHE